VALLAPILTLLLGGGFFYNNFYRQPRLTYTVLPNYDLGDIAFSGLVLENRGRVPLTDIELVVSDLEAPIRQLNLPGPHEEAAVASGGEGHSDLRLEMERLSTGSSLAVYMVTSDSITLAHGETFQVSAAETAGEASATEYVFWGDPTIVLVILELVIALMIIIFMIRVGPMLLR
jgi:hypothetical protein